jgi:hypothetical protein
MQQQLWQHRNKNRCSTLDQVAGSPFKNTLVPRYRCSRCDLLDVPLAADVPFGHPKADYRSLKRMDSWCIRGPTRK